MNEVSVIIPEVRTMGILDVIKDLFGGSGKLHAVPFHSIRKNVAAWFQLKKYPSSFELPEALSFPYEFWSRIQEIYRHTKGDGHERGITVWWVDGEFVVTETVRGKEDMILMPSQKVWVKYEPVKGTSTFDRIITVDNDVYSKRRVEWSAIKGKKSLELQYMFGMHSHPPFPGGQEGVVTYGFFSGGDIEGFLSGGAAMTGMISDVLWIIIRTNKTPSKHARPFDTRAEMTVDYLTGELFLRVYRAQFGRMAVAVSGTDAEATLSKE